MYIAFLGICGGEREAEATSRRVSFASLASLRSPPLPRLMTIEHYQQPIGFMVSRGERTRYTVSQYHNQRGNRNEVML